MATDLLIIDVQDEFETSQFVIDETIREIELAKKRNAIITSITYSGQGPANSRVLSALRTYPKTYHVTKDRDGGGERVVNTYAKHKNELPKRLRVVGVNRSYCVFDTVRQLSDAAFGVIEVSQKGTWCTSPYNGMERLKKLRYNNNVKIIENNAKFI